MSLSKQEKLGISARNLEKHESTSYISANGGKVHLMCYMDHKKTSIKLISNTHKNELQEETAFVRQSGGGYLQISNAKPRLVCEYNTYTHGVDLGN